MSSPHVCWEIARSSPEAVRLLCMDCVPHILHTESTMSGIVKERIKTIRVGFRGQNPFILLQKLSLVYNMYLYIVDNFDILVNRLRISRRFGEELR